MSVRPGLTGSAAGRRVGRTAEPAGVLGAALSLALSLALAGCGDLLLPPDPADGPVEVARAAWSEVDAYYPYFALKGVDWAAVGETYLPRVSERTGNADLFRILSEMLETLRDGHLVLESPYGRAVYTAWYTEAPPNFNETLAPLLVRPAGSAAGGAVWWGEAARGVGYLRLSSFARDGVGEAVDEALAALEGVHGLIVDVRHNGGGSDDQGEAAAGRFTDAAVPYRTVRYKSGPGHEDFGPEVVSVLEPAGPRHFTGPVVVLQNRRVFSAAEDFLLAMRVLPNVTFVGDTTGGGSSNAFARELPNGWALRVPRWRVQAVDGTVFEGVGLAPDETVMAPRIAAGEDAILSRGIEILLPLR